MNNLSHFLASHFFFFFLYSFCFQEVDFIPLYQQTPERKSLHLDIIEQIGYIFHFCKGEPLVIEALKKKSSRYLANLERIRNIYLLHLYNLLRNLYLWKVSYISFWKSSTWYIFIFILIQCIDNNNNKSFLRLTILQISFGIDFKCDGHLYLQLPFLECRERLIE